MTDGRTQTARPTGRTESGRIVVICYCGGGPVHEWKPNGGGMRILGCPSHAPEPKTESSIGHG